MKLGLPRYLLVLGFVASVLTLAPTDASAAKGVGGGMRTGGAMGGNPARRAGQEDKQRRQAAAEEARAKAEAEAKKAAEEKARLEKYDTNKDGKISKEEKAVEDADKAALAAAKARRDARRK